MIKPATYNIEVEQGATYDVTFTFPEDYDLSAYTSWRMKIRNTYSSKTALWTSDTTSLLRDGQQIKVLISAAVTAAWKFDTGVYDIEGVIAGTPDKVDRYFKGTVTLNKEATK